MRTRTLQRAPPPRACSHRVHRLLDAVQDLLFWRGRTAWLSLATCIGFQALVSFPQYVPACGPIVCLFWLHRTRLTRPLTQPPVGSRNGGGARGSVLARLPSLRGMRARPVPEAPSFVTRTTIQGASDKAEDGSDSDDDGEITAGEKGSLAYELAAIQLEVDEYYEEELEAASAVRERKPRGSLIQNINPLAALLGPIQRQLAVVVVGVRSSATHDAHVPVRPVHSAPRRLCCIVRAAGAQRATRRVVGGPLPHDVALHLPRRPLARAAPHTVGPRDLLRRAPRRHGARADHTRCSSPRADGQSVLGVQPLKPLHRASACAAGVGLFGPHMHLVGKKLAAAAAEEAAREAKY